MQLGRTVFFLWAVGGDVPHLRRNFPRVLVWLTVSALLWIAGGLADGAARFICWTLALLIEFSGPWALFWVPGLGRSSLADWDVDGSHMAERCGLFIIIALGESLLVTGATFAELVWTADVGAAFLSALLGSIAMWWIYFDSGAERAHHRIKHSRDPGREARMAYTYCHVLIVAGVIVGAVADEITPAHTAHADGAGVAAILGGPALYLLGVGPFKWVSNERRGPPFSHLLGLALLAALAPLGFGHTFSALALSAATSAVPVFVAAWECVVLRRPGVPAA
ncbi:low temperature requirement protein A [Rugamonas sp. CCM 8940]|nr:low temperature requirement protein A [Rugamonas sp. CCM 8940]